MAVVYVCACARVCMGAPSPSAVPFPNVLFGPVTPSRELVRVYSGAGKGTFLGVGGLAGSWRHGSIVYPLLNVAPRFATDALEPGQS
jgi:hypothetical protein